MGVRFVGSSGHFDASFDELNRKFKNFYFWEDRLGNGGKDREKEREGEWR